MHDRPKPPPSLCEIAASMIIPSLKTDEGKKKEMNDQN